MNFIDHDTIIVEFGPHCRVDHKKIWIRNFFSIKKKKKATLYLHRSWPTESQDSEKD